MSGDGAYIRRIYLDIYEVVRRIPRGRVATYGQVAELAGRPGAARAAGAAMRGVTAEQDVPWQRVVGRHSARQAVIRILDPVGGAVQRQLLEAEGVVVSDRGRIDLERFGWLPRE